MSGGARRTAVLATLASAAGVWWSVGGLVGVVEAGVSAAPTMHVWFGNLHSHTALSDGTGTPDEAFRHARDVARLDFLAVTDHNHLLGGEAAAAFERSAAYTGPDPAALVPAAARFDAPGHFVALAGQEYSSISTGNHVNVFDVAEVIEVPNGAFDQLLGWLPRHPDSTGLPPVLQLNHPDFGRPRAGKPPNEYGRDDFGDDAGWVRAMGAAASLVEVLNGEPPEGDTAGRSPQVMEASYQRLLQLGFHVGPTGDQDNHRATWGTATTTRTAVLAPALTRGDLLAALRARHVYATEDANLTLLVRVGAAWMGDVLPTPPGALSMRVEVRDADEPAVPLQIEALRGVIGGEPLRTVGTWTFPGDGAYTLTSPDLRLDAPDELVYLRVTQGADHAWTAPLWVNGPTR